MPRMVWYQLADLATSETLITRWSIALILIGIGYPFVAVRMPRMPHFNSRSPLRCGVPHWPCHYQFATMQALVSTRKNQTREKLNDVSAQRDHIGCNRPAGVDRVGE